MTYEEKVRNNSADSNYLPCDGGKMAGSMPPAFDPTGSILVQGMTLTTPEKLIYSGPGQNVGKKRIGKTDNFFEAVTCKATTANGEEIGVDVPVNIFTKVAFPAKMVDGQVQLDLPVMPTKGTMVEHFTSFRGTGTEDKSDLQLAWESTCGKSWTISSEITIQVQKWVDGKRVNELKDQKVLTIDKKGW